MSWSTFDITAVDNKQQLVLFTFHLTEDLLQITYVIKLLNKVYHL